ncbi:VTT domain-containing protein [Catellatospora sp. KI3]|uniref:DedA family protein n=1 Tax=Catellatospora sp. KI3 TaxID=3041620 RepID=UPI002482A392|nr:VTT domain-containing protein [Catellatospora sp. KI3]MDI1461764.1 VTT domain-containing protein [Catellatospora sp. KI3]
MTVVDTLQTLAGDPLASATFDVLDPTDWLRLFGPAALFGVCFILFAETGLMVGFFLPGDSLLFVAGMIAAGVMTEYDLSLPIGWLLVLGPLCAIIGAQLGHWLGAKYGRRMFNKPDSRLFKQEYVAKAEHYFQKFGPRRAIVLARFMPIVRTFMNPVAGVLGMPARQFLLWNVVGAILWVDGILLLGYLLANRIIDLIGGADKIDRYIIPLVLLIVAISLIPIAVEVIRERRAKRRGGETPNHAEKVSAL